MQLTGLITRGDASTFVGTPLVIIKSDSAGVAATGTCQLLPIEAPMATTNTNQKKNRTAKKKTNKKAARQTKKSKQKKAARQQKPIQKPTKAPMWKAKSSSFICEIKKVRSRGLKYLTRKRARKEVVA